MEYFDSHAITSVTYALIGGVLPTMVWLYFWTREDTKNPEPKGMIALAFFAGIMAVFISLFLERMVFGIHPSTIFSGEFFKPVLESLKNVSIEKNIGLDKVTLVLIFAPIIEELSKFVFAYILVLRSKADDEPVDPLIYMIIVALGFSAIENMLFLIDPIIRSDFIFGIQTGNMRFIGATLLHTISSATIGIFIGFNFFKNKIHKVLWTGFSVLLAIMMHSVFNYFMIGGVKNTFLALVLIWFAVIIVLLAFEKIKKLII